LLEDLGSGAMLDTARLGIEHERTAREALDEGVDLVMVSGDKLFGGPQAGIIAGRREAVATVRSHPLMRALRPGRLVLAALEATLRAHVDGRAERDVPAMAMLAQSDAVLRDRAEVLCAMLRGAGAVEKHVSVLRVVGRVGGGTLPMAAPPSWAVRVEGSAYAIERAMRSAATPVVGRVAEGALLLDVRTLRDEELGEVVKTVVDALERIKTENPNAPTGAMAFDDVE
jgi:L-seryl-tRNA(Ser) seleniumtransferase